MPYIILTYSLPYHQISEFIEKVTEGYQRIHRHVRRFGGNLQCILEQSGQFVVDPLEGIWLTF